MFIRDQMYDTYLTQEFEMGTYDLYAEDSASYDDWDLFVFGA